MPPRKPNKLYSRKARKPNTTTTSTGVSQSPNSEGNCTGASSINSPSVSEYTVSSSTSSPPPVYRNNNLRRPMLVAEEEADDLSLYELRPPSMVNHHHHHHGHHKSRYLYDDSLFFEDEDGFSEESSGDEQQQCDHCSGYHHHHPHHSHPHHNAYQHHLQQSVNHNNTSSTHLPPHFERLITLIFSLALMSSVVAFHSLLVYLATALFGRHGDQNRALLIAAGVSGVFRVTVGATGLLDMIEFRPLLGVVRLVDLVLALCIGLWFAGILYLGAPEVWSLEPL